MKKNYVIGLDFGTSSVRAMLVNASNGSEVSSHSCTYNHGIDGVILGRDPNLARQNPADYLEGMDTTIKRVLKIAAESVRGFDSNQVLGIGVDTTGSTPLPLDEKGEALALQKKWSRHPAAMAWLWKDHTGIKEAGEITTKAHEFRPHFLAKCGGVYSSEWFWAKILHCARTAPDVFKAAHTWMEIADWIPAQLCGKSDPSTIRRGICAAGHKAMFHPEWGGYPDEGFLARLDKGLVSVRKTLPDRCYPVGEKAGALCESWARRTGLPAGIPVSVGAFDAHLGAVGSGIAPGVLVKILGTSTCDIMIASLKHKLPDIPGLCGIVPESVLPGSYGLEAGQSAVGDIFNWWVNGIRPFGDDLNHQKLSKQASKLQPGESGLLALDWNNGNRTVLVDQRLSGLMVGQSLYTTPAEVYRALIEATAFGALTIINRIEEYGVKVKQIVNCGGIAEKSPLTMQIYADVTGRPMKISRSAQTCALGSAIAAAVAAGVYKNFPTAQKAMTGLKSTVYKPDPKARKVYRRLYTLYKTLHDAFGTAEWNGNLHCVMKELLILREEARG